MIIQDIAYHEDYYWWNATTNEWTTIDNGYPYYLYAKRIRNKNYTTTVLDTIYIPDGVLVEKHQWISTGRKTGYYTNHNIPIDYKIPDINLELALKECIEILTTDPLTLQLNTFGRILIEHYMMANDHDKTVIQFLYNHNCPINATNTKIYNILVLVGIEPLDTFWYIKHLSVNRNDKEFELQKYIDLWNKWRPGIIWHHHIANHLDPLPIMNARIEKLDSTHSCYQEPDLEITLSDCIITRCVNYCCNGTTTYDIEGNIEQAKEYLGKSGINY